jgi:hypothetical protein
MAQSVSLGPEKSSTPLIYLFSLLLCVIVQAGNAIHDATVLFEAMYHAFSVRILFGQHGPASFQRTSEMINTIQRDIVR